MAVRFSVKQHHVAFPTKVLSDKVGRVLNMVIKKDTDNGTVCGKGKYVSFDQYETADAPAGFEGEILEQAANGNWYVEVKKVDVNAPAILIYEVPEIAENYNSEFTKTSNFFNAATAERTKTVKESTMDNNYLVRTLQYQIITPNNITKTENGKSFYSNKRW